ncbi:UDP-glucose/GDP-mannose dehydrogenase family protein [Leucobacter ruminantium]
MIGCGYLGAVHAAAMADLGHDVVGIDVDAGKVALLSEGRTPFYEPGLDELLRSGLASGRLRFSTDIGEAAGAEVHFIAVGTPQSANDNSADMSYVDSAVEALIPHLSPGNLLVGKSTVPVGTAERLSSWVSERVPGVMLAWNPEFLREGFAVQDTLSPDRIVYGLPAGGNSDTAERLLDAVYAEALAAATPKVATDFATAELVKAAANAFLATKISFINAMAEVSEAVGADVTRLADAIGYDARIGRRFLNAGVGFGGGCLPKDIRAFAARAEELGVGESVAFLREVEAINLRRRARVVQLVEEHCEGSLAGRRIAVLGATFKPDSDDVRDSPALDVAAALRAGGAELTVTDPQGIENARRRHPELHYEADTDTALVGAEIVVLLTEWKEYRRLEPAQTLRRTGVDRPLIIDARNCLDPEAWRAAGWQYRGLGRS